MFRIGAGDQWTYFHFSSKSFEKGNFLNGNFGGACEKALETQFVCQQDKTQSGVSSGSFYYQSSLFQLSTIYCILYQGTSRSVFNAATHTLKLCFSQYVTPR